MKYIAHIDNTSGKIIHLSFPTSNNPSEGVTDGIRVLYITESNLPTGCDDLLFFIQQHWYDTSAGSFINIGMPPNDYATWDLSSSSWTWDLMKFLEKYAKKETACFMVLTGLKFLIILLLKPRERKQELIVPH